MTKTVAVNWYRQQYLSSAHWYNLRLRALVKCDAQCNICHEKSTSNDVHHINYRSLFDCTVEDLVVLCRVCHTAVHEVLDDLRKWPLDAKQKWSAVRKRTQHYLGVRAVNPEWVRALEAYRDHLKEQGQFYFDGQLPHVQNERARQWYYAKVRWGEPTLEDWKGICEVHGNWPQEGDH